MPALERTLSIIKPDATAKPGASGEILARFERAGLRIVALKRIHLSEELARGFYAVHKKRPFYGDLVKFMTSGPVVISVLEGRERDPGAPRPARPHRFDQGAERHDPRRLRHRHRAQRGARLRRRRDGEGRDRVLLQRLGDPRTRRGAGLTASNSASSGNSRPMSRRGPSRG